MQGKLPALVAQHGARAAHAIRMASGLCIGADAFRTDGGGDGALLVIAHPDDETFFFAPTLLALRDLLTLHVLCLSTGNADGLGAVRSKELLRACEALGVPSARVHVVNDERLQDGPRNDWLAELVAALVHAELGRRGLRRVITFDERGVSGHANHIAVHRGVLRLPPLAAPSDASPCVYALRSVSLLRHFASWCDVPPTALAAVWRQWTGLGARAVCCISLAPWRCHEAAQLHASQYVWFRRLMVLFSRYVHVNTLVQLALLQRELVQGDPLGQQHDKPE